MDADPKASLRAEMRRARAALGDDDRARRAASATDLILGLPETMAAGTVLVFYAFGSEVATAGLVERLEAAGARVLLPRVTPHGLEAAPATELAPGDRGPREPTGPAVDPVKIDLVVVPGLAFDTAGGRLGYGGGHYDRFLPRLRRDAVRVGLAFSMQIVDQVPTDAWDVRVDLIVTDAGVIDARRKASGAPPL